MKVISISQPYASLIIGRHKLFETRSWKPPAALVGQRIGIAATKRINTHAWQSYQDEDFKQFYSETGLEELECLPCASVLGTVELHSVELMTAEFMDDVTDEEREFGWWEVGFYAWRLRDPRPFKHPVLASGMQGFWEYDKEGRLPLEEIEVRQGRDHARQEGSPELWRDIYARVRAQSVSCTPKTE